MGRITNRHRAKEFLAFLRQIDQAVEPELDVHLILDNSSTHKTKQVQSWLAQRPRYHLHFTPTSASWLNVSGATQKRPVRATSKPAIFRSH